MIGWIVRIIVILLTAVLAFFCIKVIVGSFINTSEKADDSAKTTVENFSNTAQMIDSAVPAVLISSNYHMERAVMNANKAGFTNIRRLPAPSPFFEYGANMMSEVVLTVNELTK